MRNQLWMACCTGCKISKKNIIIFADIFALERTEIIEFALANIFAAFCKIKPSWMSSFKVCTHWLVNSKRRNCNKCFKRRTLFLGIFDIFEKLPMVNSNNSLDISGIATENNIFFCEHVGCWNYSCTNFMQGNNGNPKLVAALQNEHYKVTTFNSNAAEIGGGSVSAFFEFTKAHHQLFVIIIAPDKGCSIWSTLGQNINNIITKVEVCRHLYFIVFKKIFIIFELSSF